MEIVAKLTELLQRTMSENADLTAWRFNLYDSRGLEVGLKNSQIGGPYSAPSFKRSISGEIYLIWANHHFTSAKLDAQTVEAFTENLNLWKATAYYDADGVGLFSPEKIPDVSLTDPQIERILAGEFGYPFEILNQGLKRLQEYGLRKVDGKVRCYHEHRFFRNSAGLSFDYPQTPADFFFEVNDSYGESFSEKRLPSASEMDRVIENTGKIGRHLMVSVETQIAGPVQLFFPPDLFESFANHYLISNLLGSLVVNRQSCFALEDFYNHCPVLRDDLSLEINTLLPLKSFSYPCTSEAVPGGSIHIIVDGRLQTPILNLKYARKAGLTPTPLPSGGRGFFIKSRQPMDLWDEKLKKTELALIVYSVLGLHTQDSSSGKFSLSADQCLLVKNGAVAGKVKAVINGDFLEALKKESSQFTTVTGEDNPGFTFMANATVG
jgi:PmbA protein